MHLYILFSISVSMGFVEYLISFSVASIHLMWTEALSADDAKEYYKVNSLAPASPMIWLFCGAVWHLVATAILYFYAHPDQLVPTYAMTAVGSAACAGRISFVLGMQGPCASFETACSASLVALHFGVRGVQNDECESAIVATANFHLMPTVFVAFAIASMLSKTGACHTL